MLETQAHRKWWLYGQAAVAQSVERPTAKQKIVSSSPSQGKI